MRILIIQTAFIGDVILATALIEQLHQHRPEAQIDFLVRKGNESLVANHPLLNQVLVWDKRGAKYRGLLQLLGQIRRTGYDAVVNVQRFGATGLLTALSGAGQTIGFDKNPFSRFFTSRFPHRIEPGVHEINRNATLLKPLGINPLFTARPKLYPSPTDYETVSSFQNEPYVCIAPTSVWFTKQYPADKWIDFIRTIPNDITVYLLGAPSDAAACEHIREQSVRDHDKTTNLAGKLSLLQSAALMQGATMNYVNDSAPLHLCSAMNAPTTAVFCSTIPAFGFGPLADNAHIAQTRELLDCRPCSLHGRSACPLGHFRCATTIEIASNL